MLDVSRDICQLFEADRMTIYIMSEDGASIVSKVKTGLNSFKDIKLPISRVVARRLLRAQQAPHEHQATSTTTPS